MSRSRLALTGVAVAAGLLIPAAAQAGTSGHAAAPAAHHTAAAPSAGAAGGNAPVRAINAADIRQASASGLGCWSDAALNWGQGSVSGGGLIECGLPSNNIPRVVDSTLYENGLAVAYNRSECYGWTKVCEVNTPYVANPPGWQTWCSYSTAIYDSAYNETKRECENG